MTLSIISVCNAPRSLTEFNYNSFTILNNSFTARLSSTLLRNLHVQKYEGITITA